MMKIKAPTRMVRLFAAGALAVLVSAAAIRAEEPKAKPTPHGKLLFVLTSGLEDIQAMNMSLRHAKAAKESGYLEEVVWMAYGRGVESLANIGARPEQTLALAREAQKAGVRLIVCNTALTQMGIPKEKLSPAPDEIVANAIVRLSELVSQGYQVLRY